MYSLVIAVNTTGLYIWKLLREKVLKVLITRKKVCGGVNYTYLVSIYTHTHTHIYIYTQTYIYIYIYIYTHTHTYIESSCYTPEIQCCTAKIAILYEETAIPHSISTPITDLS